MSNEVRIRVTADDKATKEIDGIASKVKGALGGISQVAGGMLLAGGLEGVGQKMLGFANDSVAAAKESKAANAQLAQVLKSTAGAAGLNADELKKMASELEKVSLFEDEAIINAQSLLLTFTNIGKDVFPGATQTVLDMSQALGQDLKSSSIQLGKALNDPVNGITALTRVGVSFTEQQKEQIEAMVESGDVAAAQTLILAELNKEFGGQAQAASDAAGASERQKDRMNELNEVIGEKLLPIQEKWKEAQIAAINFMIEKVIPTLEELYAEHWPAISKVLREQVIPAIEALMPVFKFMAENAIERIKGVAQVIASVSEIIARVVNTVKAIIAGDWALAWQEFKGIPEAVLKLLEGMFMAALGKLPELFYNAGKAAAKGLWDGIKDGISALPTTSLKIPGLGQINPLAGRASGGLVSGGVPYIVGERGPELFIPQGGGFIEPNINLRGGTGSRPGRGAQGAGLAVNVHGNVIVNNHGANQDADAAILGLGYMIRTQARSRGAALAV